MVDDSEPETKGPVAIGAVAAVSALRQTEAAMVAQWVTVIERAAIASRIEDADAPCQGWTCIMLER